MPYSNLNVSRGFFTLVDVRQARCGISADVVFVQDSSASMKSEFEKQKKLIHSFVDQFHIGQEQLRVGFVVYGSYAKTHSDFDDAKSASTAKAAVDNAPFIGGHSRLDLGLKSAHQLFEGSLIESFQRQQSKLILIIL